MVTKYNALQMNHYSAPDEFCFNLQSRTEIEKAQNFYLVAVEMSFFMIMPALQKHQIIRPTVKAEVHSDPLIYLDRSGKSVPLSSSNWNFTWMVERPFLTIFIN